MISMPIIRWCPEPPLHESGRMWTGGVIQLETRVIHTIISLGPYWKKKERIVQYQPKIK